MLNPAPPRSIRENLSVQQNGPETLVYDERCHQAYCLNAASAAVWRLADGTRTIAEIAQQASLELAHPVTEEIVTFALQQLRGYGLLAVSAIEELPAAALADASRRALMQKLGAGALLLLPAVAMILAPKSAEAYG